MVRLFEIEAEIEKAFKKTVKDYKKGRIGIEEDLRACLYRHMRQFCDSKWLLMRLSHDVGVKNETMQPDISIFRAGRKTVMIETMNNENSSLVGGNADIERLRRHRKDYRRGYFIHIDQKDNRYKKQHRYAEWKNNYFVDLWYVIDTDTSHKCEFKRGIKRSKCSTIQTFGELK
jgi:hypothetical protein